MMVVSDNNDEDENFQVRNSFKYIKILMLIKIHTIYMKIFYDFSSKFTI